MAEDDIVFLDLGPMFEEWETDFARTYVLGDDPLNHELCRDIEQAFADGRTILSRASRDHAAKLYNHAQRLPEQAG